MEELNNILNKLLEDFDLVDQSLNDEELKEFKILLCETINIFYPELNYLVEHLDKILNIKYEIDGINLFDIPKTNFNKKFITCEERDKFYDDNRFIKNKLDDNKQILYDQYEKLINLPQPVQKSKEWFDMRNNMLTASSAGAAIGESHYNTIKETLLEKVFGKEFKENKFVYHGKKYEKIATMIYEVIYNSKIGEFGLIQHPEISYLGASPDGVSMSIRLDGGPNKLLGRMLEIKCPPSRKILSIGKIKGDICPEYYWIQVQLQLECCNLSECDFWQCLLTEYNDENDFIEDTVEDKVHSESQTLIQDDKTEIEEIPRKKKIDKRIRRGLIIELIPKNRKNIPKTDNVEWYGKYIYPPTLLMEPEEYIKWGNNILSKVPILYPELNEYKFSRYVYWKLELSHNQLITRQIEWFNNHKHLYEMFWNRVLYYRENREEAIENIKNQRLSNDIFLKTETIPILKSKKKESIFIKSTIKEDIKKIDSDPFLSSPKSKTKQKHKEDIFLSSENRELLYKNSRKESEEETLVLVKNNKKKS
jgi:putative phage-type endonuclease